jgi:hypothetical protein
MESRKKAAKQENMPLELLSRVRQREEVGRVAACIRKRQYDANVVFRL